MLTLTSDYAKVIENVSDQKERRELMFELYHLVMVENLIDLITISDRTNSVWKIDGHSILQYIPHLKALIFT